MNDIRSILVLPARQAISEAMNLRRANFQECRKIHLVNGYFIKERCGGDCKFCGWNCNNEPQGERPRLTPQVLKAEVQEAQKQCQALEIINNTVWVSPRLVKNLYGLSWVTKEISTGLNIGLCHDPNHFRLFKSLGYSYYVNDLETSPRLYTKFVTTHRWEDKLTSMRLCCDAGLTLQSGFILGLGETDEDITVIFETLASHNVSSIVMNFYIPINGMPLSEHRLTPDKALLRLAQLRLAFPETSIILGGGRRQWFGEEMIAKAFGIADTIYVRRFLDHINPFWLRENDLLSSLDHE